MKKERGKGGINQKQNAFGDLTAFQWTIVSLEMDDKKQNGDEYSQVSREENRRNQKNDDFLKMMSLIERG